jgi:hypothetical protein
VCEGRVLIVCVSANVFGWKGIVGRRMKNGVGGEKGATKEKKGEAVEELPFLDISMSMRTDPLRSK